MLNCDYTDYDPETDGKTDVFDYDLDRIVKHIGSLPVNDRLPCAESILRRLAHDYGERDILQAGECFDALAGFVERWRLNSVIREATAGSKGTSMQGFIQMSSLSKIAKELECDPDTIKNRLESGDKLWNSAIFKYGKAWMYKRADRDRLLNSLQHKGHRRKKA
jgi:hypothetical protein